MHVIYGEEVMSGWSYSSVYRSLHDYTGVSNKVDGETILTIPI